MNLLIYSVCEQINSEHSTDVIHLALVLCHQLIKYIQHKTTFVNNKLKNQLYLIQTLLKIVITKMRANDNNQYL